ncbi:MAG: family 20 glycosylhydrolase [Acetobacter orientalis]|uniref:beta-N-acetylhexosaminidase n=2 Tax=Acetobacter orientalis TaxID=146474 RepID=UPI0039E8BE07
MPQRAFSLPFACFAVTIGFGSAPIVHNRACAAESITAPVIMPVPSTLHALSGASQLPRTIAVQWVGQKNSLLEQALERFRIRLEKLSGQKIIFIPSTQNKTEFTITLNSKTAGTALPNINTQEHYSLQITDKNLILTAENPFGIVRGFSSALQLVDRHTNTAQIRHAFIDDTPRFKWRGLMVDVSRHFMSLAALMRQIDAMEMVKFNVLHLHLSDGQGFRVESHLFPRLQSIASHGQYYTQKQIRFLITYAAQRGIRIVPEFDTPGHTFALLEAYPRYAAQAPLNMQDRAEKNRAALDPTNPATYRFVTALYGEMAALFPDAYFHIGGDEVVAKQWTGSAHIQAYMQAHHIKTPADLQANFTHRVAASLAQHHKTVIGWDEIAAADLPLNTVVEVWRGAEHTATATAAGHPVIVSDGYYLDKLRAASDYYAQDPLENTAATRAEAAAAAQTTGPGGTLNTQADAPTAPLSEAQTLLVLGAEGALWTEIVSEEMLDARLWPRAVALAERFWSAPNMCAPTTLYPRLAIMQDKLELLGLESRANTNRMLSRLAPGETEAARTLLSATAPVRNYAHNHEFLQIRHKVTATEQNLTELADIASPDSFEAERFNQQAAAFVNGQTNLKTSLTAYLTQWAANDAAFVAAASKHPALTPALPTSHQLKALAQIGLAALNKVPPQSWLESAKATLGQAQSEKAASATTKVVTNTPQPAADLINSIVPGIESLLSYAEQANAPAAPPHP